ncbi:amidohydrolase family protein [Phycicoccus flavus]|uniref:amidohydrolase family protein n=1 Tax=Phycicoccus flavus TaxID=2502783 RepID=UPI000FEB8700|nr:amidohydrolase family protein [Phycicoccus flavus]NHA68247.1 amidohydrolase family protein [Phycicoccus flavus]
MRIDAHVHLFDRTEHSPRAVDDLAPADREATMDSLRERLASAGLDGAVLVPLGTEDDTVRTALASLPTSFAAVAVASPADQGRAGGDPVAGLRARRDGFPFRALRTMWLGDPGRPLSESPMLPVLTWLAAEGLVLWSYLPPDQVSLLDQVGDLVPELPVVLNHLGLAPYDMRVDDHRRPRFAQGFPEPEVERVLRLARHPHVHLMFSGHYALSATEHPYADLRPAGRRLVAEFGAERTLWGSDWPWIDEVPGYRQTLAVLGTALPELSDEDRDQILGGTACRLLGIPTTDREGHED